MATNRIIRAKDRKIAPPRILIYGQEGIGKTTFAMRAPNPIFIQTENGFGNRPPCDAFPVVKSYDEFLQDLDELICEDLGYKTLVVDHIDLVEHMMQIVEIQESNAPGADAAKNGRQVKTIRQAAGGFNNGVEAVRNRLLDEVVPRLNVLWEQRRMVVILLSHCSIEKFKTPEEEYKNYAPSMERSFSEVLTQWADCVFFAKAQSRHGGERRLYCQPTARYFAKSRYFNDEFIPIDYDAFRECCIKGKETYWQNAQDINKKEEEK